MRYSSYELKYCERCGGLGLRRSQSESPYCCECEQVMRAFLPRRAAEASAPGQLGRMVQVVKQRTLAPMGESVGVQEAAHAS